MSDTLPASSLPLSELGRLCADQSRLFARRQQNDPRYCYELFRRALAERDQFAWELLYDQYFRLMIEWVRRCDPFEQCDEEPLYFVDEAFVRLWGAITAENFHKYPSLGDVLAYLQRCIFSAVTDYLRRRRPPIVDTDPAGRPDSSSTHFLEERLSDQIDRQALRDYILAFAKDEKERTVVHASFILGLPPRQIFAHWPQLFKSEEEVQRIKENYLARLRRDAGFRRFWHGDA